MGDIALLEPGEIVPCDGIFLSGHNIKCDESGATGESDAIKKASYDECIAIREKIGRKAADMSHTDCFVVSGSKVLEGVGKYVIVAVGTKSFNGRIMMGAFVQFVLSLWDMQLIPGMQPFAGTPRSLPSSSSSIIWLSSLPRLVARPV